MEITDSHFDPYTILNADPEMD